MFVSVIQVATVNNITGEKSLYVSSDYIFHAAKIATAGVLTAISCVNKYRLIPASIAIKRFLMFGTKSSTAALTKILIPRFTKL